MAQHDGVIDNAAGAAFRADINAAIAALISNNSGASAPSTTYAYMFWADTSSGLLKQRNAANNAWIIVGTLADENYGLLKKSGGALTGVLQLEQSADIASGSTVDLGTATGNSVVITHSTGTTNISSFGGTSSLQKGTIFDISFSISGGSLSLTHNATSLIIPGGSNVTLADGDKIRVRKTSDSQANWEVIDFMKADGTALVAAATNSQVGELFDWPHNSTPSYGLVCNGAAVSRTTYSELFAKIGTLWGAGDGSTTFNVPNIPADYTTVQASGNEGTNSVGWVIAHSHGVTSPSGTSGSASGVGSANPGGATTTGSTGGSANLAAGSRVRKCIRF